MTSSRAGKIERATDAGASGRRLERDLPAPLDRLIGRESELDRLREVVGANRLVTLTGPGGVGKTRLAVEAARLVAEAFADGVTFVSLAPVRKPELVIPAIARALGIAQAAAVTSPPLLAQHLMYERRLIVLDNLEQILECGPDVAMLLGQCPNLSVLATSRAVLRLQGERVFEVLPLALPDLGQARSAAVELFVERAQAIDPSFALDAGNAEQVAAICRRLDGLPLAIELAAARIRLLPPSALLPRLDRSLPLLTSGPRDAPSQKRTLRETLDWSYELLSPEEQQLLRRLSVFVGGFTLEGVEAIQVNVDPIRAADTLSELIDHSLVRSFERTPEPRFGMLELVREYGLEQLEALGELDAARRAHAEWAADLVERLLPELQGSDGANATEQYEREHPNIRAALAYAVDAGNANLAYRIVAFVWIFWSVRSHGNEARRWIERTLELGGDVSPWLRLEVLLAASGFAIDRHELEESERFSTEGIHLARVSSSAFHEAQLLMDRGIVAEQRDDFAKAARLYDEAISIVRARNIPGTQSEHMLATFLMYPAYVSLLQGDFERAVQATEEAHHIWSRRNAPLGIGVAVECFGSIAVVRRRFDEAARRYRECLELYRTMGSRHGAVSTLTGLGIVAAGIGRERAAASFFGTSERVRAELLVPVPYPLRFEYDRALGAVRATLGERRFAAAWQEGLGRSLEDAITEACAMPAVPNGDRVLSKRELDVLALLARGESNQVIADQLYLSPRTVESHVSSILMKLDVNSRRKAVTEARARGLLDADTD
jgi:predicted ATPase/DNA-binding CsgD family transcriptional regulator